jgi:hypothetical protein
VIELIPIPISPLSWMKLSRITAASPTPMPWFSRTSSETIAHVNLDPTAATCASSANFSTTSP